MLINDQEMMGRPVAFDSEVVDNMTMKNADDEYVVPTKVTLCCPDCGQGLEFELVLDQPPFLVIKETCYNCEEPPPPQIDPFMDPIEEGRIPEHELDPLLHDPKEQIMDSVDSSVAERFQFNTAESETGMESLEELKESPKKAIKKKKAKKPPKTKKISGKAKKKLPKTKKVVNKKAADEPAEDVGGEEIDFDDDDLVETE